MEYGSLNREIQIDAAPEIVFAVVSDPAHVRQWWPDEARYEVVPGGRGEIVFAMDGKRVTESFQVVDAVPYRLFSFRWTHPAAQTAAPGNSFLVTFELEPAGDGTLLRLTETGFRERGWAEATVRETYQDHSQGWDHFLPRLAPYITRYLAGTR